MTVKLFDYLNSINYTKEDLMVDDVAEKAYSQYMINRGLSFFPDTILYANEMNCLQGLDNRLHFDYSLNIITKRKRFSKWFKKQDDDDISAIMEYYKVNINKAKEISSILSREQKDKLIDILKKE